jgi:hypothetical protein
MLFLARRGMGGLPIPGYPTLVHSYEDILVGLVLSGNALLREAASGPERRADEIAQVFGEVLVTHLVKVIASLVIEHDDKTKHFFGVQLDRVLRFFWVASICSVNVGEIPRSGSQKSFPKLSRSACGALHSWKEHLSKAPSSPPPRGSEACGSVA